MNITQQIAVVDTKKHPKGQIQIVQDAVRSEIRVLFVEEITENENPTPLEK